jgi:L-lactate dehydrogenase complex protein LldE
MQITLFVPCFVDSLAPRVAESMVSVFERLGHEVTFAAGVLCCGQPPFNAGYWDEARTIAKRALTELAFAEAVVVGSGSCAAMLKRFYPRLFEGTEQNGAAHALAERTFEFAEFLVDELGVTDLGARFPAKVTVHDGCHALRELGLKRPMRELLGKVRDLELVEMAEAETCCGFGGTFAAKFNSISCAMGAQKLDSARETNAEYVVSCDSSCLLHLKSLLSRGSAPLGTLHLAEVLASR